MSSDKNNLESKDPEDSKASGNDKIRNGDRNEDEQEADFKAENSRSKHKITIEKGKKPIDFDDLFF
jgi:hypothetical protein